MSLSKVDRERISDSRLKIQSVAETLGDVDPEQIPRVLLAEEHSQFGSLPTVAHDYGFFETVKVSRESMVVIATNRYSVPTSLVSAVT